MRTTTIALGALAVLALAGCGKKNSVEAKNESVASVAEKVANSGEVKMRPGQWETRMKVEKLDMPGLPPQVAGQMQKAMGMEKVVSACVTQAQLDQPNGGMFRRTMPDCQYDSFSMGGGKVEGKMTCHRGPGLQTMTMSGSYGPDDSAMTLTTEAQVDAKMPMNMTMSMTSHRTGDCTG
ncbi:MAG: DUF3617 domain-containing protein [Sphingomonadales bacterium]|nr:DUF3617 domain-containing protein [Sphingomonadales bacterium]